jgi:hypothetical protein
MELHFLSPVEVSKYDDFESIKLNLHRVMSEYYAAHVK